MQHSGSTNLSDFSFTIVAELLLTGFASKPLFIDWVQWKDIHSDMFWVFMNEGDNVIKSDLDQSPARRTVFVFLLLCKRKVSCTWSTRRFIFQRCNIPKKIFVCRTPGHTRIHYQQQNNSVIMWTHFPPVTPDKIIYHRLVGCGLFVYTKLSNRRTLEFNILEFWMPTVLVTEVIIGIRSSTVYM